MKIEHDSTSYLEIELDGAGVRIEVADFGGTFDNPRQCATIALTMEEAEELRNFLQYHYGASY